MDPIVSDPTPPTAPAAATQAALLTGGIVTKPGYQTSEFWLTGVLVVAVVATSLSTAGLPPKWAAACATVATAAYGISRGLAKLFNGN